MYAAGFGRQRDRDHLGKANREPVADLYPLQSVWVRHVNVFRGSIGGFEGNALIGLIDYRDNHDHVHLLCGDCPGRLAGLCAP